eukprot:jgi/Psemu1/59052/gm1.59052_g
MTIRDTASATGNDQIEETGNERSKQLGTIEAGNDQIEATGNGTMLEQQAKVRIRE